MPFPADTPQPTPTPGAGSSLDNGGGGSTSLDSLLASFGTPYSATSNADSMRLYTGTVNGVVQTATVKSWAETYRNALFNTKSNHHDDAVKIFQMLSPSGVFGENPTPKSVYNGFRNIAINAASAWRDGKGPKTGPWEHYVNALQVLAKFQQRSDDVQKQVNIQGFTDKESSVMAWNAFKSAFGRAPSDEEIKAYRDALTKAATAGGQVVERRVVNGVEQVTRKGGFDAKTWSAGYMAALTPKEKNTADLAGDAGLWQDKVRAVANAFGIKLNDVDVLTKTQQLMQGSLTGDQLTAQLSGMAKARYGAGMAAAIDNGNTVSQVVDPYATKYAELMGVNKDSVDTEQIASMIAAGGEKQDRLLSQDEFTGVVRSKPDWMKTSVAKKESYDLGQSILRMFGLVK